jgi:hypothetical protein
MWTGRYVKAVLTSAIAANVMSTPPGGAALAGETVRILEIADALLADEAVWDRSSIHTDDPVNGRYTLYSALGTACHQVTGRYSHRHPALEAVRAEIQDRVPGRRWKHRLAEFNAEASFEDVKAMLTSAIAANVACYGTREAPPRTAEICGFRRRTSAGGFILAIRNWLREWSWLHGWRG